ncbi:MAG TPA: fumarylacetoacetate hydrolase family protein [Hyphomonas sp.]|nr:fumarylacetoacetate hydrolase family protein [Hyphomonas sp.]MCB9962558.1 fumarylacetoacetate hydrolase family protein [Hyphomonas sp.]MCB9971990.1 fumarylacetoacetate hydrolase family protein [Hyphomonas sp.]HPE47449.1 fumarylacetoacetate hydrolase family protein [Hyphomonas sp.]
MRLVRYRHGGEVGYGILEGEKVVPVAGADLPAALSAVPAGAPVPLSEVELLAPVARPGKILGIGVNYAAHAAESVSFVDTKKPDVQKWFNKQATSVNDPYADVHLPKVSGQLDYEGELVVVIGKHGRHVPRERAFEIVAGVSIGCDYSVRDWQRASQTMIMGKGFDTHAPFGPAIVTLDEIGDLGALEVRSYVNGEQRQSGHVRDMIHDIPAQIAHLTAAFTLEPGDLIFTGTPAGVGAGFDPPKWLKAGDRVRVEIDGLGYIENQIVTEPGQTVIG